MRKALAFIEVTLTMQIVVLSMSLNTYISLSYRLRQNLFLVTLINGLSLFVLVVSGMGLLGLTLIDVHRQRKEIGLRLALGARPKDIQNLFLERVAQLTLLPGILGIALGYVVTPRLAKILEIPVTLGLWPVVLSLTVLAIFSVVVGFYPAHLASGFEPIQTLRRGGSGR